MSQLNEIPAGAGKKWWQRWQIWAAIAAVVIIAAAIGGTGGNDDSASGGPSTSVEATPTPDADLASDAESECRDRLAGAYSSGLVVTGNAVFADKTGRDLYADATDEEWRELGEDPDAPLVLVTLEGTPANGGREVIECWVWQGDRKVADLRSVPAE